MITTCETFITLISSFDWIQNACSYRYGSNERHRIVEDKLMRQKARLLLDEAASWSLLWYLYGKGNKSLTFNTITIELIYNSMMMFPEIFS